MPRGKVRLSLERQSVAGTALCEPAVAQARSRKILPAIRLLYYRTREALKTVIHLRSNEVKRFTRDLHRNCFRGSFRFKSQSPSVTDLTANRVYLAG